jgi:PIN domain nuclease of toxin-antitoxin system
VAIPTNASAGSSALLLDTHTLVWFGVGSRRLSRAARAAIEAPDNPLHVSAITAWEYADLEARGRFADSAPLGKLRDLLKFEIVDFGGDLWTVAARLPAIHRDPVDRMLIAHAISLEMTLVTADKTIRRYPVETLW